MTRLEAVARELYNARMAMVGIPQFKITPYDELAPTAKEAALTLAAAAIEIVDRYPARLSDPKPEQMMGRRA
jgi:hypothetical protein